MEKEFVSYEQAVALKELGFDDNYIAYYEANGKLRQGEMWRVRYSIKAPLKQQVFRFFREKLDLIALIDIGVHEFSFKVFKNNKSITPLKDYLDFNGTYEEAEDAAIDKLIQLSKQQ